MDEKIKEVKENLQKGVEYVKLYTFEGDDGFTEGLYPHIIKKEDFLKMKGVFTKEFYYGSSYPETCPKDELLSLDRVEQFEQIGVEPDTIYCERHFDDQYILLQKNSNKKFIDKEGNLINEKLKEEAKAYYKEIINDHKELDKKDECVFFVYYKKKKHNRMCMFIHSSIEKIRLFALNREWEIEEIKYLQRKDNGFLPETDPKEGKKYAIENGIAYTEDNGQTFIFNHCL